MSLLAYFQPKLKKEQIRRFGELIYYSSFAVLIFFSFLQASMFTTFVSPRLIHRLLFIPVGFVLLKIFFVDDYNWKQLLGELIIITLAVVSMRSAASSVMLLLTVFVLGVRNVSFNKIIKIYFWISFILLVGIMISAFLGIIANLIFYRGNIIRHAFGIVYPTDFASHVLSLILAYCYLDFKHLNTIRYIGIALISLLLYYFCNTRLTSFTLLILIIALIFAKQAQRGNRGAHIIMSYSWGVMPLLAYMSISLGVLYDKNVHILNKLNDLLSNRLSLSHHAIYHYGFTLFGQFVVEHGWGKGPNAAKSIHSYFFIDSSYIRMVVIYGIIISAIVLYWLMKINMDAIRTKQYALCTVMIIIALDAFLEQHLLDLSYDPFILAAFAVTGSEIQKTT